MVLEYDEKGKYFTDIIKKEVVLAQIQTPVHRIQGYVHIRIGERLSDELNQEKSFLAVTDAIISNLQGELLFTSGFLVVNRAHIVWLMPIQEQKEKTE